MENQSTKQRDIHRVWNVQHRPGMGPHLQVGPLLEHGSLEELDPFVMMNEDRFRQGTFDFHPHRGMETVTYIIDGKLKHEDNHGGYGILEPGDVQWMTAGRGIIHSEDPLPGETVHSLQLWVSLPRDKKMVEPRYEDLRANAVPVRQEEGATVRVFSGASGDAKANLNNHIPVTYVDIELEAGATFAQDLPGSYNGFIYVLSGSGRFGTEETRGEKSQVLWLGSAEEASNSEVTIQADEPLRVLVIAGEPNREPIVARGPFVMNTAEEIQAAIQDYHAGKFGK